MYNPYPDRHHSTLGAVIHTGNLAATDSSVTWSDAGRSGVNAAEAYLKSDGDVLAIFSEVFAFLATAAFSLPPPWNAIGAVVTYVLGDGLKTIRGYLERSALNVGKYCTVNVTAGVTSSMRSSWLTWSSDAAKDKIAQAASQKTWLRLAIEAANLVIPDDEELNLSVRGRLAARVYRAAVKSGAKPMDAATAAFYTAKDAGAPKSVLNSWAKKAGAKTSWEIADPKIAWKKRTAGKRVTAKQVNLNTITSGGNNTAIMYAAGALLALFILTRK